MMDDVASIMCQVLGGGSERGGRTRGFRHRRCLRYSRGRAHLKLLSALAELHSTHETRVGKRVESKFERERERRFRVYEVAPGFRPGPRIIFGAISAGPSAEGAAAVAPAITARAEATASATPPATATADAASVDGISGITAEALAAAMGQPAKWSGGGVSRVLRVAQCISIVLVMVAWGLAAVLRAGSGGECGGGVLGVLTSAAEEGLSGAAGIRYRSACASQFLS